MPLPDDINRHMTGEFRHSAFQAPFKVPVDCCWYTLMPSTSIRIQRLRILRLTDEPYVCCGGLFPFCNFDTPVDESCACLEALMCPVAALAANRFLVQTRFNKQNTSLDKFGVWCHCCVGVPCKVSRLCCTCSEETENLLKARVCVLPCSHCQVAAELDYIQANNIEPSIPTALLTVLPMHFGHAGISVPLQMTMGP